MAKVRYTFGKPTSFTLPALRALDDRRQSQLVQLVEHMHNVPCPTFDACCETIRDQLDTVALRPILADGTPRFELWTYDDEHGLVFPVGEDDATSVHCVQRHFWSTDDTDADAVALAAALDALRW